MAQIRDGLHTLGQMPPLPEMLRSLTRLSNAGSQSLQASLAAAFGFDLALLIEKPGERLQDDRKLLEQPIHTHAEVLEILDRATLDLYTMLETLGFRVQVIADVQRAVLGLESDEIAKVLAFACRELYQSSNRQETRLNTCSTLSKESMCLPDRHERRRVYGSHTAYRPQLYAVDPARFAVSGSLACRTASRTRGGRAFLEGRRFLSGNDGGLASGEPRRCALMGMTLPRALALLGVEPRWNAQSRRLEGIAILPLRNLGRPRVDVTLRISGFSGMHFLTSSTSSIKQSRW